MNISQLKHVYHRTFGKEMPTPKASVKVMQDQGLPTLGTASCIRAKDPDTGKDCLSFSTGTRDEARILRFDSEFKLLSQRAEPRPPQEAQASFFGRGRNPRAGTDFLDDEEPRY